MSIDGLGQPRAVYNGDNAAKGLVLSLARTWRQKGRRVYVRRARSGWTIFEKQSVVEVENAS